jgi:hypothetical protein
MTLKLKIENASGETLGVSHAGEEIFLVYRAEYAEGDRVAILSARQDVHVVLALDDAVAPALVWLAGGHYALPAPFGPRRLTYPPNAFSGARHRLAARLARPEEIAARRNLALNPWDDHGNDTLFPHASANVETRGEAVFAARNAIDGEKANDDHGRWPYTSWGVNQDPKAELVLDFGRPVRVDEIVLYLRADFPHDAWWTQTQVSFDGGDALVLPLEKSGAAQSFRFEPRIVRTMRLHSLVKADDPSPFPALTQIEVWGEEATLSARNQISRARDGTGKEVRHV